MGANDAQTDQGAARGRGLAGAVAGHRLQHLHRPRHRHVQVDEPPEGRRQERLLAALPLPAQRGRGRPAVQARLGASRRSRSGLRRRRDPLRDPRSAPTPSGPPSSPSWRRPTPTSAGATTSSSPASTAACPHVHRAGPRWTTAAATRGRRRRSRRRRRETWRDRRPAHPLPRARPALAARRLVVAAHRRPRHAPRSSRRPARRPSSCRRCSRRRSSTRRSSSTGRSRPGTEQFAEALDYFPAIDAYLGHRRPVPATGSRRIKARVAVPVIASLNATTAGRLGPLRAADAGRRRRRARAQPLPPRRGPGADRRGHGGRRPRARSRRSAASVDHPARGQAQPVLLRVRRLRGEGRRCRRRRPRAVQPVLPAGPRPRHARRRRPRRAVSRPSELRLPLRWIAILRPQLPPGVSLAATSGVHAGTDAVKALMVGRGRRDDDLGAAAPRPGATSAPSRHELGPGWTSASTSPSRSCAAAPASDGRGSLGLRACQLHGDAPLVGVARRAARQSCRAEQLAPRTTRGRIAVTGTSRRDRRLVIWVGWAR